ncbi:hypothetical protein D3C81_1906510 [compost metagenome]
MLEHNSAGTDADTLCLGEQMRDQHFRGRAGHLLGVMMLGNPETAEAQLFGQLCQLDCMPECFLRCFSRIDRTLIEYADCNGHHFAPYME